MRITYCVTGAWCLSLCAPSDWWPRSGPRWSSVGSGRSLRSAPDRSCGSRCSSRWSECQCFQGLPPAAATVWFYCCIWLDEKNVCIFMTQIAVCSQLRDVLWNTMILITCAATVTVQCVGCVFILFTDSIKKKFEQLCVTTQSPHCSLVEKGHQHMSNWTYRLWLTSACCHSCTTGSSGRAPPLPDKPHCAFCLPGGDLTSPWSVVELQRGHTHIEWAGYIAKFAVFHGNQLITRTLQHILMNGII